MVYFFGQLGHPLTDFLGRLWGEKNDKKVKNIHSILFFVVQLDFSEPSNNGFIVEKSWFLFSLGNDLKKFKIKKKIEKMHFKVIIRVILAPNDLLTRFDLRARNFRVNVKLSVHYRGQKFFSKVSESDLLARKKFLLVFFLKFLFWTSVGRKKYLK